LIHSEPTTLVTEPEQGLFRRVGYYDFRAYTQLTSGGLSQGFVLARHHMLVGTVQTVFRAGKPQPKSSEALLIAQEKLDQLAAIAAREPLPLGTGEQSL